MRSIILASLILSLSFIALSCEAGSGKKILILGFDGMDPGLLSNFMDEGILPNFKRLKDMGDFKRLTTSMPPQSPVAWSNFITGMNPGGHGIFDFIARDPKTYLPYLSTSRTVGGGRSVKIGDWQIPFSKAETLLMRKGEAFWNILEKKGIPATVIKVPANFPPSETDARTLSGMGTPDLLGTYGTFTFYTTKDIEKDEVTSGRVVKVHIDDDYTIKTKILGPPNPFKVKKTLTGTDLTIKIDPENPVALISTGGGEIVLKEGEWSDWMRIELRLAPFMSMKGICRFFLMKVRPEFELYMSPINIDPYEPYVSISTPEGYAGEIKEKIGYYYTQGMPEDTKALDQGFLHNEDFLKQSELILDERLKMLDMELKRFNRGLLFVYFSTTDPVQHMFWRYMDKEHPFYDPKMAGRYSNTIRDTYKRMDEVLGDILGRLEGDTTVIVLSDHGFGTFRRQFHMNTWLRKNGYLNLTDDSLEESGEFFENVDFKRTKAYAIGFNGLYVNLKGREGKGIVSDGAEKEELIKELIEKLENVRDPENGRRVIAKVYRREEIYSGRYLDDAPDLIIGYNRGYRASWETALGKVTKTVFGDNMHRWSGTHLWDYRLVPGVILTNRKIKNGSPALYDVAPTVLAEFGIEKPEGMVGEPFF